MSEQHGFLIIIEQIYRGDYDTALSAALEDADAIANDGMDERFVRVEGTGESLFQGSPASQAYCEGCEGGFIPGVRWPTEANSDPSRGWVERCDTCQRYDSDNDAAAAVIAFYEGSGATIVSGADYPTGSTSMTPFVEVDQ